MTHRYTGWNELVPASWKCQTCATFAVGLSTKSIIGLGWIVKKRKDEAGLIVMCDLCSATETPR